MLSMSPLRAVLVPKAASPTVPLSPCPAIIFLCSTNCKHEVHPCVFSQTMNWGVPSPGNYSCQGNGGDKTRWPRMVRGCRCLFQMMKKSSSCSGNISLKVLHSDRAVFHMRCGNRSPDLLWSLKTTKTVNCSFPNSLIACLSIFDHTWSKLQQLDLHQPNLVGMPPTSIISTFSSPVEILSERWFCPTAEPNFPLQILESCLGYNIIYNFRIVLQTDSKPRK